VSAAGSLLDSESSVLQLSGEMHVVGDIHGNLESLLDIFSRVGYPPNARFLCLGDYVDRGHFSTEVILLLYSLKILFPASIYLIRGNHECRSLTTFGGFREQCINVYDELLYDAIIQSFNSLPISAILNDTILCCHAGFSPSIRNREDLLNLDKPSTDLLDGPVADFLWSDFEVYVDDIEENVARGCGYVYGERATRTFLASCGFECVIRSHQMCETGYRWVFGREGGCLTIFSSVDYMGTVNDGAIAFVNSSQDIEMSVFHPLLQYQKAKKIIRWPVWLVDSPELKSPSTETGKLARTTSEPLDGCAGLLNGRGVEIGLGNL
jgi:protein phosphatase